MSDSKPPVSAEFGGQSAHPAFVDPDEASPEIKALAEHLYHGIHPALEAIGMTYAGASRDVKVTLISKAARLRAALDGDEQQIAVVINILFGR